MPIYEFYCPACHMLFSFLSRKVDTSTRPMCPKCRKKKLQKEVSMFSTAGGGESDEPDDLPIDEAKMEQAISALASDAEKIGEDDPRQAAALMRKFSDMTGIQFGQGMEEAMGRMEAGEDPDAIEEELGEAIAEDEEAFIVPGASKGGARSAARRKPPKRDKTLHEM